MPDVSILMPAYNSETTIVSSIKSVQAQTFQSWELIVINDASDDNTLELVATLAAEDARIQLISNTGQLGASASRNAGLEIAKGRYIAFLDADDLWLETKLERQIELLRETRYALCYSAFWTRRQGRDDKLVNVPGTIDYDTLISGNIIGCLTAIYDTDLCGKVPMPLIRRRHDFALWLKLLKSHGPGCGVEDPLAVLRMSSGSLSANKIISTYDTWRMYRDVIGLGVFDSLNNLCRHLAQRILR